MLLCLKFRCFLFFSFFFVLILTKFSDVKNTLKLFPKYCGENRLLILNSVQQVINSGTSNHMLEPWCWTAQLCETWFSGWDHYFCEQDNYSKIQMKRRWNETVWKVWTRCSCGLPACHPLRPPSRSDIHSELFRFVSFRPSHSYCSACDLTWRDVTLIRNSIFQGEKIKIFRISVVQAWF